MSSAALKIAFTAAVLGASSMAASAAWEPVRPVEFIVIWLASESFGWCIRISAAMSCYQKIAAKRARRCPTAMRGRAAE
jgi:hypothetical protein